MFRCVVIAEEEEVSIDDLIHKIHNEVGSRQLYSNFQFDDSFVVVHGAIVEGEIVDMVSLYQVDGAKSVSWNDELKSRVFLSIEMTENSVRYISEYAGRGGINTNVIEVEMSQKSSMVLALDSRKFQNAEGSFVLFFSRIKLSDFIQFYSASEDSESDDIVKTTTGKNIRLKYRDPVEVLNLDERNKEE